MAKPTFRLLLCCHGFVASVLLATNSFADSVPAQLTAAQIREDLTFLKDQWGQQDRSFNEAARARFDKELRAVAARADRLTPAEFTLEVARLVAISGNGHSALSMPDMPALPIRVWWFSDGLHVVSAHPEHADLVGVRIERIGDTSADEALRLA